MENRRIQFLIVLMFMLHGRKILSEGDVVLVQDFYKETCPLAEEIVRRIVKNVVVKDPRMAASLLRLHFMIALSWLHLIPSSLYLLYNRENAYIFFLNSFCMLICFGDEGCDASVLLESYGGRVSEKQAGPNVNSVRGFEVIDEIKFILEDACPHTVSCADILTITARDAVALVCNVTLSTFLFVDICEYSTLNLKAYLGHLLISERISESEQSDTMNAFPNHN